MSKLHAARGCQYPLVQEFTFNVDDTMVDVDGVERTLGEGGVFDIALIPLGAVLIGGEIVTEVAFNGTTFGVAVGDAADDDRYLASADRKAAARVALVPTGHRTEGANLRLTITPTGSNTAGRMTVRPMFVIENRAHEVATS